MNDYLSEVYDWITKQDNTFSGDVSIESFQQKMQDDTYAKEMYNWMSSIDKTFPNDVSESDFLNKVKKKDTSELQEAVSPGGIQDTPSTSEDGQSSLVQKTQDSLERRFVSFADEKEESLRPFYEEEGINYDDFLYANKVQEKVKEEQSKTKSGRAKSRIADQSQIDEANRYLSSIDDNVLQAQSKIERKKLQDIIDSSKSTLEYEQKIASSGLDFRMLPMEQLKINGQAVFGKELESKLYDQDFIEAYQKGDVTIDIDTSSGIEYFKEMEMLAKRQLESGGQWGDVAESLWAGGLDLLAAGPLEIIEGANALLVDVVEGVVIKPVSEAFGGEEIEYGSRFKHYMKEGGYYGTKIKEYTDDVREDIRAYEQQGITKSLIAGNYSDAFFQGSNALAESTPLIVGLYASTPLLAASFGSKAASAITLTGVGASAAGVKSLDLKKMRRDGEISISDGQLIANMILTGVAEGLFEKYTLGLINSARKIVKTTNTPAKELADSYIKGLGKSFGVESTSEGLTEASNIFTDAITGVGTPESLGDFLSQVADAQLIGGVMGVGMHSVPYVFNALTDVSSLRDNISAVFTLEDGTTTEMKFTEARNFVKDKEISQGIRDGRIKMDASITEKGRQILEEIVYGYYAPDNVEARAVMFEKEKAVKDLVDSIEEKSKPREDADGKTIKGTPPTPEDVTSIADAVSEMEAEGKKNKYNVSKSTEAIRERVGKFFKDNGIEVVDAVNDQDTSMSNVTETVESNSIDSVEEYNSIKQQLEDGKRKPTVVKSQNQNGIKIKGEDVQKSDITQGKFKSVSAARNAMKEFEAKQKANKNVKPTTEQIAKDNNKAFVKAKKDALDSVPKEVIDSGDYHIISPDRAGLTKAELQSRMENTRADLEASGATVYTITEVVDGKPKQSLLVTNTTNAVALGTARGLQVQSVFSGKDGILNTDGSIVPLDNSNLSGPEARRAGDISIVNVNGRKTSIHRGVDKSKTVFGKSFDANNVHRLDESDPNYDKELLDGVPSDRKRALGFALKFLNSIDGLRVMVVRNSDNMYKQLKSLGYSDMKAKRGAYSNSLYRGEDGTIYINLERVKGNTLFHEIAHPLVDFMKRVAPKTYAKIEEEVSKGKVKRRYTEDGKRMKGTYLEWAFLNYTEPSEKAVYFNRETQKFDIDRFKKENPDRFKYFVEEAFAEMIGDAAYGHFLNKQSRLGKLRELIREILSKIGVSYFEQPEKISLDDLRLEDGLFKSGVLSNVSRALVNERTITVGGIDFEVSESEYGTRGQLSELESIEIAKEVTDKVIQGKSVDTYKSTKTSKEKGGKYVSFSGEINVDNVKKESMTSYVSEASKFFLYNTTPTSPYDQLRSNMEGASKKEIKTVLDHNKAKIKSKINSLEKSIKKSSDKSNIESIKSDLKILKSAEKSKTLNDQLDLILSVSSFALKNSLYRNTFFKLGDSGLKINKDSDLEAYSDSIIELSKSTIKSNLKVVYDSVSKNVRDISKLWYDGANLIAQDMASSYGVSLEQASAIIATQSPQMPWFDNLHLADVIMDVLHNRKEEVFSQEMFDYYVEKAEGYASQKKYIPELKKSIGKKLSELNQYDKAIFIRTYFDLYLDRKAPIRIPTGTTVEFNQTSNSSFGGYNTIAKAVSVFEDGSMENISNNIGNANKVRNFYLNIANPTDKRAVTIDTHAMAIALFKPLASNDNEVNFGPASFAVYADAYRELASEIGIEARSLQSITWEAARAIFPAKKKADPKYKEEINSFWSKYNEGSLPLFEVQNYIFRIGDNPNLTEWSNYINNLKDEKNRGNVSGRISRLGGVDPSIQSRDNTIPDERVSDTREKDTLSSRRPDADVSDGIRAQAPNVEEVVWEESKIGKGDRAITNRNDAVQRAANDYFDGNIEYEEYLETVKENSPIKPITKFIDPASLQDIETAVGSKAEGKLDVPVQEGTRVGLRLDIPAYTNSNIWAITVHEDGRGKAMSYTNVARINNVEFMSSPKVALGIARGRSKATIARMLGNWSPIKGETAEARAENAKSIVVEVMNDPSWVQVGMNPFRHSYFYDRLDGMPVVKADEVVQIGGLVYAKNAEKVSPLDERFRDPKSGLRFQISGEEVAMEANEMGTDQGGFSGFTLNQIASENYEETTLSIQDILDNDEVVKDYVEYSDVIRDYDEEATMPPIIGSDNKVIDGYNRIHDAYLRGEESITVYQGIGPDIRFQAPTYDMEYTPNALISLYASNIEEASAEDWMRLFIPGKKGPKPGYVKGTSTDVTSMGLEEILKAYQKEAKVKSIPKEVVESLISTNMSPIETTILPSPSSMYDPYTLPGGEKYREFLIHEVSGDDLYKSTHYGSLGQNLIATARVDDRVGPNGEKILFVQEIQSDWVQGTNKGDFTSKDVLIKIQEDREIVREDINKLEVEKRRLSNLRDEKFEEIKDEFQLYSRFKKIRDGEIKHEDVDLSDQYDLNWLDNFLREKKEAYEASSKAMKRVAEELNDLKDRLVDLRARDIVFDDELSKIKPYLPWNQTDLWVGLTIRKLINQASKEGYDQIAFVNGDQSNIIQGHSDNETVYFYNTVVPKNINNELKRLVKGMKYDAVNYGEEAIKIVESGMATSRLDFIEQQAAVSKEKGLDVQAYKSPNAVINLTPELKAATDKVGPLRFQAESTEGETNVYRTGLAAIAWDIGMNVIMADYAAGKYITGSGVFRLIDKSKRRAKKEDRGYDVRLSTLLGKPFGTHSNEEIKEIMVRSKGNLNLELNRVSEASKRLEKAIKGSDLTSERVNELLHNKSEIDKLQDSNLKRALVEVRSHIDRLSRTLIDEGLINGQTQFTVDANMGVYISRSYKQFERKNWKQTDTDIEKRAKEFLYNEAKKEYPNYTEAKLRDKAQTALDNLMDEKDFAYYMTDGANLAGLSRINTIFKQRKLVPKEIREFWGENDNPVYNYSQTASKIARTIAAERMYKELLEVGDGKFVSDEQTSEFFNEISGERFGSLNGKFVDNEMFAVMNQVNRQINSDGFNKLYNLYMKLVLFNKKMKTIYNPGTHVKNVIGNTAFAMMNGHINFDVLEMYGYAKETYRSLGTASDSDARALYEKLISLGVVNSSASLQELRNIAEDISKNEFDLESFLEKSKFVKFIVDGGKWVDKKVTNAYQMEDDMWKIFGFLSERGRYLDAGLDLKTAEELSAKNIRNLYPNYDQIPRVIRMLGRSPLVGSFVAFQAEAVRNAKNAIKLGFEEIGSDNPKIRNIGASRLAGTLATTTLVGGLQLYTAQFLAQAAGFLGEDEEESEARKIRFLLPKWDAVGNLFVFDRGTLDSRQYEKQGSGDVYFDYINFSSISGIGYIKDVFRLAFTDIETKAGRESATRVLEKIYEPFLSQEMTAIAVKEALDNSKEKIYKSTDKWYDKLFKMIKHVGNNVQPGGTRAGTRIYEAEFDEGTDLVTEYEILALAGIRISRVNVNKNLSIKGYFINQDMIRLVGRDGMKSEDAVRESYRTNERFDEELNKMADVIAAAVEQGISGEDAENILRYGRDSKKRSGISEYVIQEAYQRWLERYIFDSKNVE